VQGELWGSLLERPGFRGLEAEIRTRLSLCYMSWEPDMDPDEPHAHRLRLLKLQHEVLPKK
jgi:hypothetical protein